MSIKLDNYKITRKICRKFCFTVYEAVNRFEEQKRFLKVLNEGLSNDRACVEHFLNSTRVAGKLNHKSIYKLHSFGQENEFYFIEAEPVNLTPLSLHIHEEFPFPLKRAIDILLRVSKILREAHLAGIIHGVLNPSSIYIGEDDQIKIDDFCHHWMTPYLSKIDPSEAKYLSYFIAPELFDGNQTFDGRSDIYSLGVVFVQLLTDQFSLNGFGDSMTQPQNLSSAAPSLRTLYPGQFTALEKILKSCLNKNPEQRYFNLSELAADLKSLNKTAAHAEPARESIVYSKQ